MPGLAGTRGHVLAGDAVAHRVEVEVPDVARGRRSGRARRGSWRAAGTRGASRRRASAGRCRRRGPPPAARRRGRSRRRGRRRRAARGRRSARGRRAPAPPPRRAGARAAPPGRRRRRRGSGGGSRRRTTAPRPRSATRGPSPARGGRTRRGTPRSAHATRGPPGCGPGRPARRRARRPASAAATAGVARASRARSHSARSASRLLFGTPCRQRYGSISSVRSGRLDVDGREPLARGELREHDEEMHPPDVDLDLDQPFECGQRASRPRRAKSRASISSVSRRTAGRYSVSHRRRRLSMWSPITGMCCFHAAPRSPRGPRPARGCCRPIR